jgi:single-stranded DNA-binding protein
MDLNLAVFAGTLSAPPEIRTFESGSSLIRFLVTVRATEPRKRTDNLPIVLWDPPEGGSLDELERGDRIWAVATVQRRFWSAAEGRKSRVEIVAHHVEPIPIEIEVETAEAGK